MTTLGRIRDFFCCCCSTKKVQEEDSSYASLQESSTKKPSYGTRGDLDGQADSDAIQKRFSRGKTLSTHRQEQAFSHHILGKLINIGKLTCVTNPDLEDIFRSFEGRTIQLALTKKPNSTTAFWIAHIHFKDTLSNEEKRSYRYEMDDTTPQASPNFFNGSFTISLTNNKLGLSAVSILVKRTANSILASPKSSDESKEQKEGASKTSSKPTTYPVDLIDQYQRPLHEKYDHIQIFTNEQGHYVLSSQSNLGNRVFGQLNKRPQYNFVQIQSIAAEEKE